jgi:hypothetical protein
VSARPKTNTEEEEEEEEEEEDCIALHYSFMQVCARNGSSIGGLV